MNLKELIGSGDKIGMLTLPFLIIALILNVFRCQLYSLLEALQMFIPVPGVRNTINIFSRSLG
jgi:hypothetical protein